MHKLCKKAASFGDASKILLPPTKEKVPSPKLKKYFQLFRFGSIIG